MVKKALVLGCILISMGGGICSEYAHASGEKESDVIENIDLRNNLFSTTLITGDNGVEDIPIEIELDEGKSEIEKQKFNRKDTYNDIYRHIKENNNQLEKREVEELANVITNKIQAANEQTLSYDKTIKDNQNTEMTVIDLGQVIDGKLVNNKNHSLNVNSPIPPQEWEW